VKSSLICCTNECSLLVAAEFVSIERMYIFNVLEQVIDFVTLSETSIPSKPFSADYRFDNQVGGPREKSNRVAVRGIGLALAT